MKPNKDKKDLDKKKIPINYTTTIILLLISLIILLIIGIAFFSQQQDQNNQAELFNQNLDQSGDPNRAEVENFPESIDLLELLPYSTQDFSVSYLPLEKGNKPKIFVRYLTIDANDKYVEWLKSVTYDPQSVEFVIQEIPQFHGSFETVFQEPQNNQNRE